MQKGSWGGGGTASGRGRGGGGRGAAGPRYTPAATTTGTLDQFVTTTSTKSTKPPTNRPTARSPSRPTTAAAKASPAGAEAQPEPTVEEDLYSTTDEAATGEVIYTVGYGGLKSTEAFVERLKANGITRLLDIRISPHCGFNKDFTGRAMGVLLRKQGIAYEHFMELGNVWRSEGSEPELDAAIRLRLYRELMTTAGELLTRRLRQRVQAAPHERICILCACGDVRECHRNIVATYLHEAHHYTIRHI